ncbi:MAG: nucleotidyltransferase domain-containing protein, partial [Candidatus Cloacimonetes bacterium]|nr:nucleotidyltransferase domain-containing protein [Candidatus Cloacimonadota bacterium]
MKNGTEYLLELAKRVTKIYTEAEGIKSIAIGASVSKGMATEFSDIDIIMIYDKIPTDEFFDNAFKINGGT